MVSVQYCHPEIVAIQVVGPWRTRCIVLTSECAFTTQKLNLNRRIPGPNYLDKSI